MRKIQNKINYVIGIVFLLLGIAAIINTVQRGNPEGIIWFCYLGIIIIGAGILKKNSLLIISQLNILAIPLIVWSADFLYLVFTGNELLGISTYFFDSSFPLFSKIISLQHLFTIPLSIYILYKLKPAKTNALKLSFVQLALIFFITKIFTQPENNINCVYSSCINTTITALPYPIVWFGLFFILIFITNYLISKIMNVSMRTNKK